MYLYRHESTTCRWCGKPLWYGLKEEASGWKVFYSCDPADGCGWERMTGRIPLSSVDHHDDVYERAESMIP